MAIYCIPDLSSVPGPTGQFDWWSAVADPTQIRFYPDNPNWLGAFSLSEGGGANRDMQFRALKGTIDDTPYLFLSWVIRISALNTAIDRANFVLGDGTNYVAIQVKLNTNSAQVAGTQNSGAYTYRIHSCTLTGDTISINNPAIAIDGAAIENAGRIWVDVTSPGRGLNTRWAFQVAIPLGVAWAPSALAIPVSGAFKLWYEVIASLPNSATVKYHVPPPLPPLVPVETSNVLQIVPSGLQLGHLLDLSTGNVGCTAGVELTWGNVGVRNVDPANDPPRSSTTSIRLDLGQVYPPNKADPVNGGTPYNESHTPNVNLSENQNQFFATPTFPAGFDVSKREKIRATFSLANWGSQIGQGSSWTPVPGGSNVQFLNQNNEVRFVWPTSGTDVAPTSFTTQLVRNINKYLNHVHNSTLSAVPIARHPHQCVLVELFSDDSSVVITRSSIYQNMNVTSASIAREPARISIEGLTPIGAEPRDVYLYLQTFNMPKEVKDSDPEPSLRSMDLRQSMTAIRGTQIHNGEGEGSQSWEVEDIAAFYPTYIVHVYHDTGNKMTLEDGRQVPILRPQTAFGHFVSHEGNLVGWETRLYGAEKIADNFYRLRVPNHGARYVETAIQARESANETPLPSDDVTGCYRLIAWLETKGLLGRLLAIVVRILCQLLRQ